ncbi:uncharacterized protein LOC134830515 [Culicoides brevitarsis]|uniref:uncharacterized protein LOC134830515 n=1 Tax=Culicoides brevitarsis TaxID=469753 RepID=UPI00307B1F2A
MEYKILIIAVCILSLQNGLLVNGYKVQAEKHPDHPNECWDKETNSFYQSGSLNQRKGKCEMIRCYADYSMDAVGCHSKPAQTGCSISSTDFSKSYPDCCPRINCQGAPQTGNTHQTASTQATLAQPGATTKKPSTTIHLPVVTQKPATKTK